MRAASWIGGGLVAVIMASLAGCASSTEPRAAAPPKPAAQGSGHWVYLPPETGTLIRRRVWVDDSGSATNADSTVGTYSPSQFEQIQRNSIQPLHGTGGGR
jgi:hypothetical protein